MANEMDFEGLGDAKFLIGEITAFSNRFQTVADRLFKEISWKQFFALACIRRFENPPTINELSEVLGSSHQNVKQLLLKLEKAGYIELVKDAVDKRKQRVLRTEKATEFDQNYVANSKVYMNKFFECIDAESLRITIETIVRLEQKLKTMEDLRQHRITGF